MLKELRNKLATTHASAKAILEKAKTEKRDLTAEESAKVDEIYASYDTIKAQITDLENKETRQRRSDAAEEYLNQSRGRETQAGDVENHDDKERAGKPVTLKFRNHTIELPANSPAHRRAQPEYMRDFNNFLRGGGIQNALRADEDTDGGFLKAPTQMVAGLIQAVDDAVAMRGISTVLPPVTNADSIGVPTLDTDISDPDWTSELDTGSEDDELKLGKRELKPHPLAKRAKISNKLLRMVTMSAEGLVRTRLSYKFAVAQENAFLTGNGAAQPLGVFTASNDGIPTSRDVAADNTGTAITADGLINAKYFLKAQYQAVARWMFHRDAVKQVRKLKDGEGQYLWRPGLVADKEDRILDLPYIQSEFVPNTFTTGQYVGIIGDFRHYWIVDSLTLTIQRLVELYAATNQTGFIGRLECDGAPVLAEAFARVKLG